MTIEAKNAKRDQIANDLRNRAPEYVKTYMAQNRMTRQSDMRMADWIDCHETSPLGGCIDGTGTPSVPVKAAAKPEPKTAAKPGTLATTIDGLGLVLSDKAIDPLRAGIAALEAERDAMKAERDAANAAAANAANAATVASVSPAIAANVGHIAKSTGKVNAGTLFKGDRKLTARGVMIDVCDHPDAPAIDPDYRWPETTAEIFAAIGCGFNILMSGGAGTGKSTCARQIAAKLGRPYFQIGFHGETSSAELFGMFAPSESGGVVWQPGDLLAAMQIPFAVCDMSEISFARPDLTAQLLSVLEENDGTVYVGGVTYRVHPTVLFLATSNDSGNGEQSHQYHGTRALNPALLSRFQVRPVFTAPNAERLSKMIAKRSGMDLHGSRAIADFAKGIDALVSKGNCETGINPRALMAWAQMTVTGTPAKKAFDLCVLNGAASDDAAVWGQQAAAVGIYTVLDNAGTLAPGIVADIEGDDDDAETIEARERAGFTEL